MGKNHKRHGKFGKLGNTTKFIMEADKEFDTSTTSKNNDLERKLIHTSARAASVVSKKLGIYTDQALLRILNSITFIDIIDSRKDTLAQPISEILSRFGTEFGIDDMVDSEFYLEDYREVRFVLSKLQDIHKNCLVEYGDIITTCNKCGIITYIIVGRDVYSKCSIEEMVKDINMVFNLQLKVVGGQ